MRRISFALTTDAVIRREKTVTRRVGWLFAKVGDQLLAVDKLRTKNARKLAVIEIVSVRRETLADITQADVDRECLGGTCVGFILGFKEAVHLTDRDASDIDVTRIEFKYVEGAP